MEALRQYLNSIPVADQKAFAASCGTSVGYMRNGICDNQRFSVDLVIAIERNSGGRVRCEDLRPDVDWKYLHERWRTAS